MKVKGFVYDKRKLPMPGVTVKLIGTSVGAATNANGWFVGIASRKGTVGILFCWLPWSSGQFFRKDGSRHVRITMHEDVQAIEEVVVTGYGDEPEKLHRGQRQR